MKRRPLYGTLHAADGTLVRVNNRSVAQALADAEIRIGLLETALKQAREWDQRRSAELKERNAANVYLQNHPWTRLGEALRIVRPNAPRQDVGPTPAR